MVIHMYKKFTSLKTLEKKRETLLNALYGSFILYAGETIESREKTIRERLKMIDARIKELQCQKKSVE